ncbi:MAG: hypothetical protein WBL87_09350 [Methanothrix sp.]
MAPNESAKKGSECCGDERSGSLACGCLPQPMEDRVTPNGTRLLAADRERMYRTGDGNLWLTREDYKVWSRELGLEVDPIVWYTRMGHPLPPDVKV